MRKEIQETLDELERQRQDEPRGSARGGDLDQRMLAVGPDSAKFINTLVRAIRAERVIEVGGSMGYSTVWLGEAVEAVGGRMTTLEIVDSKIAILQRRIQQAGLANTVQVKAGDARASLRELEGPFHFVLVDAWKDDYPAYFDAIFPKLAIGGLMVADNIIFPEPSEGILSYLTKARTEPNAQTQTVAVGNGLEVTIRLG